MPEITLTVNGRLIKGQSGDTVLAVCRANGIEIPTLCHFEGLSDVGACRLCAVEIQGERRPVPSCTYPAREGLVIKTHTPQLEKYRREILELLFAERNHFCMFCQQSGDCELQNLAYRYQMDNVRFEGLFPRLPVDTISKHLAIDHNRCILCGRCVRACEQISGVRTLDFAGRGYQTMITADIGQSLGESSCTLCGACLQACPTGAIINKNSMFKGKTTECRSLSSVCPGCDIGCEINVLVKDNNLVRIEAPDMNAPRGSLCRIGRFELISESRQRITSPLKRSSEGKLVECSLDEALKIISQKVAALDNNISGLVSARSPNETIEKLQAFVTKAAENNFVDTLDGAGSRTISAAIHKYNQTNKSTIIDQDIAGILKSDCILLFGDDIDSTHPVVGNLIRRAVSRDKAKLIIVDAVTDTLSLWSDIRLKPKAGTERVLINGLAKSLAGEKSKSETVSEKTGIGVSELDEAALLLSRANDIFIICGSKITAVNDTGSVTALLDLADPAGKTQGKNFNLLFLKQGVNSRGACRLEANIRDIKKATPKAVYLLLGDDSLNQDWMEWLKCIDFVVLQASYVSPAVELADVVLPSQIWAERSGTYITTDGRTLETKPVLEPPCGLLSDSEILQRLARKIKTPGRS